jgi:hypothetical protein
LAVVTIDGRDFYLGRWNSLESHLQYDRRIAEWLANGRRLLGPEARAGQQTVSEIILAFDTYAEQRYPASGRELENFRRAFEPLRDLYGRTAVRDFGPKALMLLR